MKISSLQAKILKGALQKQYNSLSGILINPNISELPDIQILNEMDIPLKDFDNELINSLNEIISIGKGEISFDKLDIVNSVGLLYIILNDDYDKTQLIARDNLAKKLSRVIEIHLKNEVI